MQGKNILDYVKESKKKKLSNLGFRHRVATIHDGFTGNSEVSNVSLNLPNIRQQRKNGQIFTPLALANKTEKKLPVSNKNLWIDCNTN